MKGAERDQGKNDGEHQWSTEKPEARHETAEKAD